MERWAAAQGMAQIVALQAAWAARQVCLQLHCRVHAAAQWLRSGIQAGRQSAGAPGEAFQACWIAAVLGSRVPALPPSPQANASVVGTVTSGCCGMAAATEAQRRSNKVTAHLERIWREEGSSASRSCSRRSLNVRDCRIYFTLVPAPMLPPHLLM